MPDWVGWLANAARTGGWEAADVVVTGLFAAAAYGMARKTARLAETDQTPLLVVQHHGKDDYRLHNSGRGAAINVVAVVPRPFNDPQVRLGNPIGAGEYVPFLDARDVDSLEPIRVYYQRLTRGTTGGAHWFMSIALTKSLGSHQRHFAHSVERVWYWSLPSDVISAVSTTGTMQFLRQLDQWWRPTTLRYLASTRLPVRYGKERARILRLWRKSLAERALREFMPEAFPVEVMSEEDRGNAAVDLTGPLVKVGGMAYQLTLIDRGEHWCITVSVAPERQKGVVVVRKDLLRAAGRTRQERNEALWAAFRDDYTRRRPQGDFAYVYLWRL